MCGCTMNPDRAHRLLNTILLVFILAVQMVNSQSVTVGIWQHVYAVGVYGAMLLMIVLLIKIGAKHQEQIQAYLGRSTERAVFDG